MNPTSRPLRIALFLGLVTVMALGPTYTLVTGGSSVLLRNWVMYAGYGVDIADADFHVVESDGTRRELDALRVLGYDHPQDAPLELRRLGGSFGVMRLGRRLRDVLGDDVDLRVDARVGRVEGWVVIFDDEPVPPTDPARPR